MDVVKTAQLLMDYAEKNPEAFSQIMAIAMNNKGFATKINRAVKHKPIANPQRNWEKLMYYPTNFKQVKDPKTGEMRNPNDLERRNQVWKDINSKNTWGDIATGIGAVISGLAGAHAQQMQNRANMSASDRQRELYGPTTADRAAAATVPMHTMARNLAPTIAGLFANNAYRHAQDEQASLLRALMGAEHNNMDTPGVYADSWRKLGES